MRLGLQFINASHVPGMSPSGSAVPHAVGSDSWPDHLGDISSKNF